MVAVLREKVYVLFQQIKKKMTKKNKTARIAGFLYLMVILTGIFSLMYVPSKLIVWNDPTATVNNIKASTTLYRLGIVSGLISFTFFAVLPLVLYKLLNPVNRVHAMLMVVFALIIIPIAFVNEINHLNVLSLISDADYLKPLQASQIEAQVMLSLTQYEYGNLVGHIF